MRYFAEISYVGTNYHGWQQQKNAISVQEVISDRLSKILGKPLDIVGSGRTDAGVHARQQYFHFDSHRVDELDLKDRLNRFLPKDISVNSIKAVKEDAHARFDAVMRSYKYTITRVKDPFLEEFAAYFFEELDLKAMGEACSLLLGRQDFTSFSRVKTDVNHFECEISSAGWSTKGHRLEFDISADRFLRGMVRAIVGTLLDVGIGKYDAPYIAEIIAKKDRKAAGSAVPAKGLCLTTVKYPESLFL